MNNFRVGGQSPITFDRFIRGIIALVIIGGIFAMIYALSGVLIPFFVAWVAAYLLYPLVRQLHKRLHNRFLAIFLTISLTIAALGTFVYIVIPPMLSEITHLKDVALSYIQAGGNADGIPQPVQKLLNEHVNEYKIEQFLQHEDVVTAIKNTVPRVWELLWSTAGIIINFAASLIGLLYLLFLLTDYEKYANSWITFIPPSKRPFATRFVADVERCMAGYFRGQALIALSNCVMFSIGFALVDFPLPIALGCLIGVISFVPYLQLVGVVPAETLRDNYSQLLLFALFIVSFSIFLLVFVNLRLSEWITAPMKKLDHAVRELEKGVESVDFNVDGPYEVEHLSHSVQSMISTMRHLMEDVLHQEEEKRRSELDVLQSQINPHFLYNTLDSVVWMTENGRTQEAVVMLTALARFFRISLSKGSNIIPIGDEIEHARNYLTIQKMRYKNKFSADISVEPGVEKLYTIKLIIQPILENAIYHGMEYADGDGEIHIRAFREGETVVIEVEDNGPGMSEEIVEQLLKPTRDVSVPKAKGSGIGFRNVHQRIQLTFGSAYGLTIRSEPDNGTVVRICLPVLEEEDARKYRKEGER